MRIAVTLIGLALLTPLANAQDGPEIHLSDGKVSMSAQAVPLSRLLALWDRATGQKSQVLKPELANRNISVKFTNLEMTAAVKKIFEGQPLNYFLLDKGIVVTDSAQSGGTTSAPASNVATSAPFPDNQPVNNPPVIPVNNNQPPPNAGAQPQQPAQPNNPFGNQPNTNPAPANAGGGAQVFTPGQLPPPLGATNPLTNTPAPSPAGFPNAAPAAAPVQPSGPGAVSGTPGQIAR